MLFQSRSNPLRAGHEGGIMPTFELAVINLADQVKADTQQRTTRQKIGYVVGPAIGANARLAKVFEGRAHTVLWEPPAYSSYWMQVFPIHTGDGLADLANATRIAVAMAVEEALQLIPEPTH
jgi:hypothetical protein